MHYFILSFTHKNSTLAIREQLAYPQEEHKTGCLTKLNSCSVIDESILLSTCNRMEVICYCSDVEVATEHIFTLLSNRSGISVDELQSRGDIFEDKSAIHHLFSVAGSLDSLVVGETQIAGQLKDAFRFAHANKFCGHELSRAIHYAFKCAAEIRNSTNISSNPISVASVAVAQVKKDTKHLEGLRALVIGAGEMSSLTAKHLIAHGVEVTMMNRTRSKAEAIATEYECKVRDFEELYDAVNEYELLFTSTGSKKPIITDEHINTCNFRRYWVDIAVPRDIDCSDNENIKIYYVDDLKTIIDENLSLREDEAALSYATVAQHTKKFYECLKQLSVEPIIKEIYSRAYDASKQESSRVISKGYIPQKYEQEVVKMGEQVIKRFLHDFTSKIRSTSQQDELNSLIDSLNYILDKKGDEPITCEQPITKESN
ncbi:MAG: glutamyl-tRNA reductase [Campylobacterota bacterium]|nr:glutamyl-tRNA reductase [Campylobacterota bacterium]